MENSLRCPKGIARRTAEQSTLLPGVRPAQTRSRRLLRHHNGHLLLRRASPAILSYHHNGMLARKKRLSKMPETAVRRDIGHRLTVDDQRGARLGAPDDFGDPPMELRAVNFEVHLLGLALRHQSELERLADFARLLLGVRGRDVPEIISRIEPAD